MGSFSELVMSFRLQADVGPDVLASFASIAVPDPGAPALPLANPEDFDWWPDSADCDMSAPWSKDWGAWLGGCATEVYIDSDQRASMIWRRDHWTVTAR